jgi:hypothetical protein
MMDTQAREANARILEYALCDKGYLAEREGATVAVDMHGSLFTVESVDTHKWYMADGGAFLGTFSDTAQRVADDFRAIVHHFREDESQMVAYSCNCKCDECDETECNSRAD